MYWSDCSGPATIQTARVEDGGDQQILISDNEHSCIVSIAIEYHSIHISFIVNAKIKHNLSIYVQR